MTSSTSGRYEPVGGEAVRTLRRFARPVARLRRRHRRRFAHVLGRLRVSRSALDDRWLPVTERGSSTGVRRRSRLPDTGSRRLSRRPRDRWGRPAEGSGQSPRVFSIPGNHDWYDSLQRFQHSSWVAGGPSAGGGSSSSQSYFAAELPARWWMLGVDIALDQRVDDKQVRFFRDRRQADRRARKRDSRRRQAGAVAARRFVGGEEPRVRSNVTFSTPRRYASSSAVTFTTTRYGGAAPGPARITCGGGGPYTAGTHHLPGALKACWSPDRALEAPLHHRYPEQSDSLQMRPRRAVRTGRQDRLRCDAGSDQPAARRLRAQWRRHHADEHDRAGSRRNPGRGAQRGVAWGCSATRWGWRSGRSSPRAVVALALSGHRRAGWGRGIHGWARPRGRPVVGGRRPCCGWR